MFQFYVQVVSVNGSHSICLSVTLRVPQDYVQVVSVNGSHSICLSVTLRVPQDYVQVVSLMVLILSVLV